MAWTAPLRARWVPPGEVLGLGLVLGWLLLLRVLKVTQMLRRCSMPGPTYRRWALQEVLNLKLSLELPV
jgi:hypothetical protein